MADNESTSQLIEYNHGQSNKSHPKCHNFSIESILSSASSALALAANQEANGSCGRGNSFSLHSRLLEKHNLLLNQKEAANKCKNQTKYQNDEEQECIKDDEEEDVDVESRSSSPPSHPNHSNLFDVNDSNRNLQMFGLSKGKKFCYP